MKAAPAAPRARLAKPPPPAARPRGENMTRQVIADAAERAFARHGYDSATVRNILAAAGVRSGLMSYYFPSKEELYSYVISRKEPALRAAFLACLPDAGDAQHLSAEASVRAYFSFFFETAQDPLLGDYLRLLVRSSTDYEQAAVRSNLARFDFIHETMLALLARAVPQAPLRRLRAALLFMEAAVTTLLITTGLAEHRLRDGTSAPSLVTDLADLVLRGISA